MYWTELLVERQILKAKKTEEIMREANELLAIIAASIKTARKNK